jgi:hypothetical protein
MPHWRLGDRRVVSPDFSIEHLAATSAHFNGVLVPGRSIEGTVARYVFNVFINNDHPEFPVSFRGTGTAIRFNGRELFVCTQHQLDGADRQAVGMMADGGGTLVTSGGERHYIFTNETDAHDLVAFDFTEPVAALPQLRSRFFNFRRPYRITGKAVGFLLTGLPYADQSYEVEEHRHIGVARRQVLCTLDQEPPPADTALMRVVPRQPLTFNPDGMSGGSAFVVRQYDGAFWIDFAGIVVRGGQNAFHVVKADVVHQVLESFAWLPKRKA